MMTLYKGYYRRKLTEINAKKLFKKQTNKFIEFEGEVIDVNPDELQSMPDEMCKALKLFLGSLTLGSCGKNAGDRGLQHPE